MNKKTSSIQYPKIIKDNERKYRQKLFDTEIRVRKTNRTLKTIES